MWGQYLQLISGCDYSIQLGDFGFDYKFLKQNRVDPKRHAFIPGNHDNYETLPPHSLGDFGPIPFLPQSFFVRGAYSIDRHQRMIGRDWWPEEQLEMRQMQACLDAYVASKPRYVFTHDCPSSLIPYLRWVHRDSDDHPDATKQLLQVLLEEHTPEYWFFGHWHRSWQAKWGESTFICLNSREVYDLEVTDV